ncbi:O-antigen ligase family protein [Nocardioides sp.]|uniref:O-antigen ligase family protein n=1 Tax=Nocardioides sp. TaxID=35761 RepID=UPI002F3FE749
MTITLPRVQPGAGSATPTLSGGVRTARILLWLAVMLPFIYTTSKTAAELSGGGSLGALEVLRGGGPFVLWGLSILAAPVRRRGFGAPDVLLALYALVIVMSASNPLNPNSQASLLKSITLISVILAMWRLVRLYDHPRELVVALVGWVHVVLIAGAVQILVFKSTVYAAGATSTDGLARLNLVVPSVSANPLAFVGVAGILSCALGVGPRWLHLNVFVRNALMGLYVYEIFLTRTRSALGVGLVIVAVSLVVRARRHPLSTITTAVVFIGGAVALMPSLLPQLHTFLQRGQTTASIDSLSGRTVIWDAAYRVWQQHQTLGLGYYSGHRLGIPGLQQDQSNIDNTWLETLVDVGLVGIVPLALFTLVGVWRLARSKLLSGDIRLWGVGIAVYVVAISFINPTIQQPGAPQVVLTLLILSVTPRPHAEREQNADDLLSAQPWLTSPAHSDLQPAAVAGRAVLAQRDE